MVPVEPCPPKTDVGLKVKADTVVATKVKLPFALDGPMAAFRDSSVFEVTWVVATVNVPLVAPDAIVIVDG